MILYIPRDLSLFDSQRDYAEDSLFSIFRLIASIHGDLRTLPINRRRDSVREINETNKSAWMGIVSHPNLSFYWRSDFLLK